jgi:hypothetical protein
MRGGLKREESTMVNGCGNGEGPAAIRARGRSVFFRGETAWYWCPERVCWRAMGHCKGKTNVKKRAARRKKTERLALAKGAAKK